MIILFPVPAVAGLKNPPLTPVPLYAPPAGVPPLNSTGEEFKQTPLKVPRFTDGIAFTKILEVSDAVHPEL